MSVKLYLDGKWYEPLANEKGVQSITYKNLTPCDPPAEFAGVEEAKRLLGEIGSCIPITIEGPLLDCIDTVNDCLEKIESIAQQALAALNGEQCENDEPQFFTEFTGANPFQQITPIRTAEKYDLQEEIDAKKDPAVTAREKAKAVAEAMLSRGNKVFSVAYFEAHWRMVVAAHPPFEKVNTPIGDHCGVSLPTPTPQEIATGCCEYTVPTES